MENVALLRDDEEIFYDLIDLKSTRIILVGKTGSGKSTTGNTILGETMFKAEMSTKSVTHVSKKFHNTVDGRRIVLIDTPGFCGSLTEIDMITETERCVEMSLPGPHAFLLVISVGRFTKEDLDAVQLIEKNFGKDALKYTIVLFTHIDLLNDKPLQLYIEESKELLQLIKRCNGRYHSFNNRNINNTSKVTELLNKIQEMFLRNGERYYTNEMFEKAQKRFKFEKKMNKAKEIASATGLAVAGAVGVGLLCSPVGALVGTVGAAASGTMLATGAAIGAGVTGGVGAVGGAVAGGVIGAKSAETLSRDKKSD